MKKVKIKKRNEKRFDTVRAFKGSTCTVCECACQGNKQTTRSNVLDKTQYVRGYSSYA